jgi:hypothetical protein
MRDDLAHAYPPANWRSLHEGVTTLLRELDRYVDRVARWAADAGILANESRAASRPRPRRRADRTIT